jgi:hypothetical protein
MPPISADAGCWRDVASVLRFLCTSAGDSRWNNISSRDLHPDRSQSSQPQEELISGGMQSCRIQSYQRKRLDQSRLSATTVINLRHACMGGWSHRVNDFSMRYMSLWINKYAWTVGPSIVWVIPWDACLHGHVFFYRYHLINLVVKLITS